jgi:hypothetical protein
MCAGQRQRDRVRPGCPVVAARPAVQEEAVDRREYAVIKEYAASYNSLTDAQAQDFVTRSIGVDESFVQLRLKYIPIFQKVLSGKKTAMFFQMDKRIALMIDLQLASIIPIVQP